MPNYVIKNATVYTENKIENTNVFIKDNIIEKLKSNVELSELEGYEVINANGKLVLPGLINLHTHIYMTTMRNIADDIPFTKWLFEGVMPVEERFTNEFAYLSCQLGLMEAISTGTTCILDMHLFEGQTAKACKQAGFRAYVGRGLVGEDLYGDGYSRFLESIRESEEFESELIHGVLSPHAIYTCSKKLIEQVIIEAKRRNMLKQTHLAESEKEVIDCKNAHGVTPVKYLNDLGFLDEKTVVSHCVQLNENDIELLAKSGVGVVTNPASNLKLYNGIAPAVKMLKSGVRLALGTDGAASNNTQNMFREMNIFNLIHCLSENKLDAINARTIFDMATKTPAKILGQEGKLGEIKQGAIADLVIVDLSAISLYPNNNILSSLSNSASGNEVESVMINGKWVYKNKEFLTIDKEKVYSEISRLKNKFIY